MQSENRSPQPAKKAGQIGPVGWIFGLIIVFIVAGGIFYGNNSSPPQNTVLPVVVTYSPTPTPPRPSTVIPTLPPTTVKPSLVNLVEPGYASFSDPRFSFILDYPESWSKPAGPYVSNNEMRIQFTGGISGSAGGYEISVDYFDDNGYEKYLGMLSKLTDTFTLVSSNLTAGKTTYSVFDQVSEGKSLKVYLCNVQSRLCLLTGSSTTGTISTTEMEMLSKILLHMVNSANDGRTTPTPQYVSNTPAVPPSPSKTLVLNITPTPLPVSQSQPIAPDPGSAQIVSRNYEWSYQDRNWTLELQLPQALYDYYKGLPRPPTKNYSIYVTHPLDDRLIEGLANKIREIADQQGFDEYQMVSFAAAFVQSLPYTSDLVTTGFDEYPRYPIETLFDNGGDCEDTSILMASIMDALGYGVVLLIFPESAAAEGHAAVGVAGGETLSGNYWTYGGNTYFYLETTGDNWSIGEAPAEYERASANIYPMVPVPVLTDDWTSAADGSSVELKVTVSNLGSADARDVRVYSGFDAGNDLTWNSQRSQYFDVSIGGNVTVTLDLEPPVQKETRLIVIIEYGGYAVDKSYSKWFSTY